MADINIIQTVAQYETGDTRQFTINTSATAPQTVAFNIYNFTGALVAPSGVQSGDAFTATSDASAIYCNRVLPSTPGLYVWEWILWDTASRTYYTRNEFEVVSTLPVSFFTYGDVTDIVRTARNFFGRTNMHIGQLQPYCQASDGYIDSFLGQVMTVPLSLPVPPIIADMSKVYTLWRLSSDRHFFELNDEDSAVVRRKNDYDKFLIAIAAGSQTIVAVGSSSINNTSAAFEVTAIPDPSRKAVFDMRDFIDQRVSPTTIDEEDGRDV